MPFGMVNSPATFNRMMQKVFAGTEDFTDSYIDDLIVFSESWEEHKAHVQRVLEALRRANLTAKPNKCSLGCLHMEYLGYVVGNGEVRPTKQKVEAMTEFPRPATKKQVRSFLGLIGYYRRFVPRFSELAAPLTDLTAKGKPNHVKWTGKEELSFQCLKQAITKAPVLSAPDFSLLFILQTDASDTGIGAVLLQEVGEDRVPIMFLSKKLLPREKAYSTIEKECLAIVWVVQTLQEYLLGKEFVVETDHCPLQWLSGMSGKNQRLLRWSLMLQEYSFTTKHIPGKSNVTADSLSRA